MAVTDQQKLDFLLKKIGYTKTKTGSVVGTGAISGTPKQPFAEAIPSPLIIANGALWNESGSIPTTPPGSDTAQVKVYLAATSGLRMTADSTSSGQRAFIAYSTYGNSSSTRLTNWIDTQFGSAYLIKVYKGDPNSGGVALSAAGSGANDGWFFDYSAGVLNFNDTSVPSGVTDTNIYIVGYRYIGLTGAPTPTGGGNFTYNDLVVTGNLQVAGISTFNGLVDINAGGQANTFKVEDLTDNRIVIAGTGGELEDSANLTFDGSTLGVTGDATFSGNVSIGGTLTYEDVKNIDAVGLITARSGIRVTGGVIEALAGENKIPSLYAAMGNLPSAGSYHGMFAHVHATGRGYFAHAGNWYELVNKEVNGVVGTGTETYNIGNLVSVSSTATSFNVTGVTTVVTLDVNGDIDVDGHTNLDNVSIAGVSTITNFGGLADFKAIQLEKNGTTGASRINFLENGTLKGGLTYSHDNDRIEITVENNESIRFQDKANNQFGLINSSGLTLNGDLDVDGHTNLDNVSIAGFTTVTQDLDVDGHTNLDNVSIAGFTTVTQDLDVDGHTNLDNVNIAGVTSVASLTSGRVVTAGTGGKLQDSNNLTFDGTNLFVSGINVTQPGSGTTSTFGADIVTRNLKATGLSTFVGQSEFDGNAKFDSTITAGGSAGSNGQYLKTTGSGVEWATFPTLRTRQTFTASSGQTTFSFSYTVNFIDVFVNGIKLTDAEFTATNGTTVVLAVGCFVGDIVELVSYNTVSGGGGGGGGGISNVVEDTTPQLGGDLDLFNKSITGTGNVNITGIISATSFKGPSGVTATFIGDGSGLTNVIGSGSGVVVKDDGNVVGTAGTINFAENLSVTPISAGIVTVGVSSASLDINKLTVTGITTFAGISTFTKYTAFNPPIGSQVDFFGGTSQQRMRFRNNGSNSALHLNTYVNLWFGDVQTTQMEAHGTGNARHFRIKNYQEHSELGGTYNTASGLRNTFQVHSDFTKFKGSPTAGHESRTISEFNYYDGASLYFNGVKKLQTCGVGVTITSQLDVTNINASGVTTTTEVRSNALSLKNAAGSATYAIFTNGGSALLKHNNTDRLETSASGVTVTGTVAATAYTGDGSQLTGITGVSTANVRTNTLNVIGVSTLTNIDVDDFIDVGSNIQLGNAGVVTATTFKGDGDFVELDVDGHTNLDNVNIAGVVTATSFVGDGSGLTGITASGTGVIIKNSGSTVGTAGTINFGTNLDVSALSGGAVTITATNTQLSTEEVQDIVGAMFTGNTETNITATYQDSDGTIDLIASGGGGGGTDVGITTNLSGSFTASAGTPATINTFTGYSSDDLVIEYTIYIKNGSDFQTQKLLAMRDGTTIHSTQFAVMFSSSLLVQCDATISSGNILLRATPETGVSGSTTYKIKREVM